MTLAAYGHLIGLVGTVVSFIPIARTIYRVHSAYAVLAREPASEDMREVRRLFSGLLRSDRSRSVDLVMLSLGALLLIASQGVELYLALD
jgi:hypothetical protein